jgi:hypothetical protein
MVSLTSQKDFRAVQRLPFCYLCSEVFEQGDETDRDHVPPDAAFAAEQKEPLLLPTHVPCNRPHGPNDEKMARSLGLLRGYIPSSPNHRRLEIEELEGGFAVLTNFDVHAAVRRWVRGFHAA